MNFITCKAQWLARPMTSKTSMDGWEGPGASTQVDDGFGSVMVRGQLTKTYNCFFKATGRVGSNDTYDGTIDIPNTPYNREKIAAHIRSRDLRVVDRELEKRILSENHPDAREKRAKIANDYDDMPVDFDGSKIVLNKLHALVDADPVEDAHASDAVFTEVKKEAAEQEAGFDDEITVRTPSLAEVKSSGVPTQATKPPRGADPRAGKAKMDMTPDVATAAQE